MPEKYLILKKNTFRSPAIMGRKSSNEIVKNNFNFDFSTKDLTSAEASLIKKDLDFRIAPVMPLRLIQPRSSKEQSGRDGNTNWALDAIGATQSDFTGEGVTIAILDTGINRKHEAFTHMNEEDLVERDFTGEGNGDQDGHGTHCAGIIFGTRVNDISIGVAPNIKRALIGKVIGSKGASTNTLVLGIQWAIDEGADVISLSLGIDFPEYSKYLVKNKNFSIDLATSKALSAYRENLKLFDALGELIEKNELRRKPTIVIAAAGNSSRRDVNIDHTIDCEPPAISEGFISVGAIQKKEGKYTIADFSNTGPDLVAPGVNILSADVDGGLIEMDGTSMATPFVVGVAALWIEKLQKSKKRITSDILHSRLKGRALDLEGDNQLDFGNGLVQAP